VGINTFNTYTTGSTVSDHQTFQIFNNPGSSLLVVTGVDVHGALNFSNTSGATIPRFATNYLEGIWAGTAPFPGLTAGSGSQTWLSWGGLPPDSGLVFGWAPETDTVSVVPQVFIQKRWRGQLLLEPTQIVDWAWATIPVSGETTTAVFEGWFTVYWDFAA
jgi:hypothetical protein